MRWYFGTLILLAVFAGCQEKTIGYNNQPAVRIRFKNEIAGNIIDCKIKLFLEKDSVQLGPLAQGEYSKYIDGTNYYTKGADATPAEVTMHYRLSINNTEMFFHSNMLTRVASPTTQKLGPGDYTIGIRWIEWQPNSFTFSFTLQ